MDLQTATTQPRDKVGAGCGLGAVPEFDRGDDGALLVGAREVPDTVSNDASPAADCTASPELATLGELPSGALAPTTGFMLGRFKVAGHMSVALKLQRIV
jgi:putative sterol carrier protein